MSIGTDKLLSFQSNWNTWNHWITPSLNPSQGSQASAAAVRPQSLCSQWLLVLIYPRRVCFYMQSAFRWYFNIESPEKMMAQVSQGSFTCQSRGACWWWKGCCLRWVVSSRAQMEEILKNKKWKWAHAIEYSLRKDNLSLGKEHR